MEHKTVQFILMFINKDKYCKQKRCNYLLILYDVLITTDLTVKDPH